VVHVHIVAHVTSGSRILGGIGQFVQINDILTVHVRKTSILCGLDLLDSPAPHQLVVHPQCRILDLPSSATTVFYDIASTMMGAMKMTCYGHPFFNGIHLTFVLVRDDGNVSYVH
jgi:hypothetical protein